MKYAPPPSGPYWLTGEKYIGPPHLRGREALLAKHRRTVAIIRGPQAPRDHRLNPVQSWERRWFGKADGSVEGCMTLFGVEGAICAKWRRLRDRWIASGCRPDLRPWVVWEVRS